MFLSADGESGKRYGNETIRVTDGGHVSIRLPAALAHLANAPHGRYALASTVTFGHRAEEWRDRITADRAVAYRIHYDVRRAILWASRGASLMTCRAVHRIVTPRSGTR